MKTTMLLLILIMNCSNMLIAQSDDILVGPISMQDLLDLPGWLSEDFLTYQPNREYMEGIPQHMHDIEIICVLGTWCSDSKREVPRMLRILQMGNIEPEKMRLIGVDRQKNSPDGANVTYNIERVPTFIFLRDGVEIGRIVEEALASLEKDMLGIIIRVQEE